MDLHSALDAFFTSVAPLGPGDRLVVAFSGGVDSSALLWGLGRLAGERRASMIAAHLDHGLDRGSARRARAARRIADAVGTPLSTERVAVRRRRGESLEAAARRVRYDFLARTADAWGARYIATGHQRDDQVETILLRLAFGSGLAGLAGIAPRSGRLVRPLLALGRRDLEEAVAAAGLEPVEDPGNRDLARPRNRIRHRLRPHLESREPGLGQRLASLAPHARRAVRAVESRLEPLLAARRTGSGLALPYPALATLPDALRPFALALLHRRADLPYPPPGAATRELSRQLAAGRAVGCDCGGGWRWSRRGAELVLERPEPPAPPFAYELVPPGAVDLPEAGFTLRLHRRPAAGWMLRGEPLRAGLALEVAPGDRLSVRNRRPGDRIRPFGCAYSRRLKDLLIDRKIARAERDRLPLLCCRDRIVWVPGVTIDDRCRIRGPGPVWQAELRPL